MASDNAMAWNPIQAQSLTIFNRVFKSRNFILNRQKILSLEVCHANTVCFADFDSCNLYEKLVNLYWWFGFRIEPIFATSPAALNNDADYKMTNIIITK